MILRFIKILLGPSRKKNGKPYCPAHKHYCYPIDKNRIGECLRFNTCKGHRQIQELAKELGTVKDRDIKK